MVSGATAEVVFAAGTVVALVMTVVGWRMRIRHGGIGRVPASPSGPGSWPPDSRADTVLRGGAWVNGVNVSWPFATLRVDASLAELRVPFLTPVWIRRDEVAGLEWRSGFVGRGVRFRTASGRLDRVTFWVSDAGHAQRRLAALGWR